jgi:hypothetical protein
MIESTSSPGCADPYHGLYRAATVYVVDLNGPNEQFFRRGDRVLAAKVAASAQPRLSLNHHPARQFCHDLMCSVLGA